MNKSTELYIYIDESGTLWSQKNERYFVLCALITDDFQGISLSNSINHFIKYKYSNIKTTELHASQMSFQEKVDFFVHVRDIPFKIAYVVLDKNNIDQNLFKNNNSLFNYMIFLLLEEYIKDSYVINLYITVDNRNIRITSEKSLEEYLIIECIKKSHMLKIYTLSTMTQEKIIIYKESTCVQMLFIPNITTIETVYIFILRIR
ncbi:DUF3800 domain-containing protein [Arenimonas sp.]|nr:DUF3800 domain-containing protein [Candidatus Parcubacteria bacterium]